MATGRGGVGALELMNVEMDNLAQTNVNLRRKRVAELVLGRVGA